LGIKKHLPLIVAAALLPALLCGSAYGQKVKIYKEKPSKKKDAKKEDTTASAEPDKVLYQRALAEVKKSHYTEARLDFQTLINTYPDSEYLAKAKLGVADSYYKEGGTSNLTLAVSEYKNFIVFFPFLDEAAYAQMQVAMSHYRMMEKSDRDNSEAIDSEQEFQTFLLKYPQSPLVPKAEQDLRNVQEVLADGEYRTARFYYLKPYYPAAAARLFELSERYPLYSHSDEVLWMLGDIYMRAKKVSKSEDDKNHWGDLAATCYARIVKNYPLSPRAAAAKAQLTAMGQPVPQPDPEAVARMKQDQLYVKQHHPHLYDRPMSMIRTEPDVLTADRYGNPNLDPPDDIISAKDVLSQGAAGPVFDKPRAAAEVDANGAQPSGEVTPIDAAPANSGAAGMAAGAQIIAAPASAADAAAAGATPSAPPAPVPAPSPAPGSQPPTATGNPGPSTLTVLPDSSSSNSAATTVGSTASTSPAATTAPTGSITAAPGTAAAAGPQNGTGATAGNAPSGDAKAEKADPKTESSSKKKKGLKKIVPL
jgi:outer membrane protein assembly factor BamD